MLKNLKFNKKKDQRDELIIKRVDSPEMMTTTTPLAPAAAAVTPAPSRPPLGVGSPQMHRNSGASTSSESSVPKTPTDSPAASQAFIALPQNKEEDESYYSEGDSSFRNKTNIVPLAEGITYSRGIEFKEEVTNIPVDDNEPSDDESLIDERPVVEPSLDDEDDEDDIQKIPVETSKQPSVVVSAPRIIAPAHSPPPKPASPKIEVQAPPQPTEEYKKEDRVEIAEPAVRSQPPSVQNPIPPVVRKASIDTKPAAPLKVDAAVFTTLEPVVIENSHEKPRKDVPIPRQAEPQKVTESKSVGADFPLPREKIDKNLLSTDNLKRDLEGTLLAFIGRMDILTNHNSALSDTLSQARDTHKKAGDHIRALERERDELNEEVNRLHRSLDKFQSTLKDYEDKCGYWKNKHDVVLHEKGMVIKDNDVHIRRVDDLARLLDVQSEKAQKSEEERRKAEDECRLWKEKYLAVVRNHHEPKETTGRVLADERPATLTVPEIRSTTPLRSSEDRHHEERYPEERRRVLSERSGPPAGISLSVQDHSTIPARPRAPGPYEGTQSLPQAFTYPEFLGVWDSASNNGDEDTEPIGRREPESEDRLHSEHRTSHTIRLGDSSLPLAASPSDHYDFSQ